MLSAAPTCAMGKLGLVGVASLAGRVTERFAVVARCGGAPTGDEEGGEEAIVGAGCFDVVRTSYKPRASSEPAEI